VASLTVRDPHVPVPLAQLILDDLVDVDEDLIAAGASPELPARQGRRPSCG
jgi:hypothetical protein